MDTDPDPANDADPTGSGSTTLPISARIWGELAYLFSADKVKCTKKAGAKIH